MRTDAALTKTADATSAFGGALPPWFPPRQQNRDRRSGKGFSTLGRRHLDPIAGRFLEPDSAEWLEPTRFVGINPYAYCLNNPIDYTDPSGHSAFLMALLLGIAIGAGAGVWANIEKQLFSNGARWDEIDWAAVVGAGLLGGALGACSVLGGAAGLCYAGVSVGGYALSGGASLAIALATASAGNMLNYSFAAHGDVTPEGLWNAAWKGALKGAATFGLSFYSGTNGLFLEKLHSPTLASDFFFRHPGSEWVSRMLFYRLIGELGPRILFVTLSGAVVRWMIDEW